MSNLSQRKKPATSPSGPDSETDISLKSNESGSLVFTILKVFVWIVVLFFFCSYLVTETWTWGYEGKYTNLKRYIPKNELVLSEEQLKVYDGSDPKLPIYIAIDGEVFDVTEGRGYYGPGGSYHQFAGRDAARAYVTGCFETHLTHDLRDLTEEQIKSVEHWKKFYREHHTYLPVGRVMHAPINPASPIPEPCDQASPQKPASS